MLTRKKALLVILIILLCVALGIQRNKTDRELEALRERGAIAEKMEAAVEELIKADPQNMRLKLGVRCYYYDQKTIPFESFSELLRYLNSASLSWTESEDSLQSRIGNGPYENMMVIQLRMPSHMREDFYASERRQYEEAFERLVEGFPFEQYRYPVVLYMVCLRSYAEGT